jgi:hypothetical protein
MTNHDRGYISAHPAAGNASSGASGSPLAWESARRENVQAEKEELEGPISTEKIISTRQFYR